MRPGTVGGRKARGVRHQWRERRKRSAGETAGREMSPSLGAGKADRQAVRREGELPRAAEDDPRRGADLN